MTERSLGPVWMGGCIITALVAGALVAAALKLVATPTDYQVRLDALEQKVQRAERLTALPSSSAAYPKGAVCEGLDSVATDKVRQALDAAAASEGLESPRIAWGAPLSGEPAVTGARIAPLTLSLQVQGPYEKIASFLGRLSNGVPMVFVDTADLNADGVQTRLDLSGKVFCWTRG